jgi:hypothetical protein
VDEAGRYHRVNNSQYIGEMTAFCAKWGLENVSFSLLLRGPDESVTADDIAAFEALLAADGPHSPLYPAVGSRFERVRISVDRDRSDRRIVISWIGRS